MRPNELIGSGFGSLRIDFDAALKIGAVFDADSRASNVTSDGAVFRDFDAPASMDIADDLTIDNYFAGANFRIELRCGADGKFMAAEGNRALHNAVDLQVFRAGDLSFNLQAGTPCAAPIVGVWYEGNWCTFMLAVACSSPRLAPGAAHCGIITGSSGVNTRYDGEPAGGIGQILNPFTRQPALIVLPSNGGLMPGETMIFQASVPQGTVQCIQNVTNDFNASTWTYSAVILNSNSYAKDATSACGLNVNFPWNAFGY